MYMTGEPEKHSGLNYSVISLAKVTQISFHPEMTWKISIVLISMKWPQGNNPSSTFRFLTFTLLNF